MSKDGLKDISHDVKINPMDNDNRTTNNIVSQPDVSQPRVSRYAGSGTEKAALLNVTPEDLPSNMPMELRRNIVKNANEVYHLGTKNNIEYATVFDARTGKVLEPMEKHRLITNNKPDSIKLPSEIFIGKNAKSISVLHNHTNGTIHSGNDTYILDSQISVDSVFLASDGRLLRIVKKDNMRYNLDISSIWIEIGKLILNEDNRAYALANAGNEEFNEIVELFRKYGLTLERW